ncbi:putative solute-binding protein [Acinetobacter sp. CFCC 10889]|uniref:putative solute-binding protein n=1 Tax=Acinetobacter sp. CFCC 10889 TaxID=1775557 RepID=UPI000DD06E44|nr:putative solute-binding protein [Acinetobacter sp. CFCC 10889]
MKWSKTLLVAAGLCAAVSTAQAKQVVCVFDLVGKNGDVFNLMKDYQLAAKAWGADIELKVNQNEGVIAEDFKAGKCDGISVTGMRGRQFNNFTGSLDAIGAIPDLNLAVKIMQGLTSPNFSKYMTNGQYEVVGVIPVGDAFLMVNDRNINTVAKAAGKKIAVLDYDQAQKIMVQQVGAQAVSADVTNFGAKFNNGQVDIIGAPAAVFKPLELHKGLGTKGAIVNYPILQVTGNLIIRKDKFPEGFGQKSRDWVKAQLPRAFGIIGKMKADIPAKYWMQVPPADKPGYQKLMRESRISLTQQGVYNKQMMKLLWQFRCKNDPKNFECALQDENYK